MFISWATQFAHEVYVLTPEEISQDQQAASPSAWQALSDADNWWIFIVGFLVTLAILSTALWLKRTKPLQKIGKFIDRSTGFAPDVIRVAFGASLILSAANRAMFGPELPLDIFPAADAIRVLLVVLGAGLILGIFSRLLALAAAGLYGFALADQGWYMLTYINYLGEAIAVVLLPLQKFSVDKLISNLRRAKPAKRHYQVYSLPLARWLFGLSIIYAAINVKFVTANLSVDVVNSYELTRYLPFDPLLIVLAAGLIESLIGVLYILGLLQRFNSVFFLVFLTASILFFKEDVWPHYLLIALAIGVFLHKPDDFALDKKLAK